MGRDKKFFKGKPFLIFECMFTYGFKIYFYQNFKQCPHYNIKTKTKPKILLQS